MDSRNDSGTLTSSSDGFIYISGRGHNRQLSHGMVHTLDYLAPTHPRSWRLRLVVSSHIGKNSSQTARTISCTWVKVAPEPRNPYLGALALC